MLDKKEKTTELKHDLRMCIHEDNPAYRNHLFQVLQGKLANVDTEAREEFVSSMSHSQVMTLMEMAGREKETVVQVFKPKTLIPLSDDEANILQAPFPAIAYSGQLKAKGTPPKSKGRPNWGAPKARYYEVGYRGMFGIDRLNTVFPGRWGVVPHDYHYLQFNYEITKKEENDKGEWKTQALKKSGYSVSCDVDLMFDGKLVTSQPGGHILRTEQLDIGVARKSAVTDATKRLLFVAFGIGWRFYLGVITEEMCKAAMATANKDPWCIPISDVPGQCWERKKEKNAGAGAKKDVTKTPAEDSKPSVDISASDIYREALYYTVALKWDEEKVCKHYHKSSLKEMDYEELADAVNRFIAFIDRTEEKTQKKFKPVKCTICSEEMDFQSGGMSIDTESLQLICFDCLDKQG